MSKHLKHQAKQLKAQLAQLGHQIPHGHALEAVARMSGARDWNTAAAEGSDVALSEVPPPARSLLPEAELAEMARVCAAKKLHVWKLSLVDGLVEFRVQAGATELHRRAFKGSVTSQYLLDAAARIAAGSGATGYLYATGRVWRASPGLPLDEAFSLDGQLACLYASPANRQRNGSVLIAFIKEGERCMHATDWDYGADLGHAETVVAHVNEQRGVSPAEADFILMNSMFGDGERMLPGRSV